MQIYDGGLALGPSNLSELQTHPHPNLAHSYKMSSEIMEILQSCTKIELILQNCLFCQPRPENIFFTDVSALSVTFLNPE